MFNLIGFNGNVLRKFTMKYLRPNKFPGWLFFDEEYYYQG